MSANATPPANGTLCWLEIPAKDIPRVAAFYNAVLGWTCLQPTDDQGTPSPLGENMTVHMFTHETLNGAFLRIPSTASIADATKADGIVATFKVDDVAESLAKVEESGGKAHTSKLAVGGDRGYFAKFIDTEGNVLGLYSSK